MQSLISHFNQYSLADPPWDRTTFPAGFERGLAIDSKSYDAEFDTTVILGIEFHEYDSIFIPPPPPPPPSCVFLYS